MPLWCLFACVYGTVNCDGIVLSLTQAKPMGEARVDLGG